MSEFNIEEISQEMNTNPDFAKSVLESAKTTKTGQDFIKNHNEAYFETNMKAKIGETHRRYDEDIEAATGLKKPDGVKTYDFLGSVLKDMKAKSESFDPTEVEKYKSKITELETKISDGQGGDHFKGLYEGVKDDYKKLKEDSDKKILDIQNNYNNQLVSTKLNGVASRLKFREDIPDSVKKMMVDNVISNHLATSKMQEDGTLLHMGEDGNVLRGENAEILSTSDLLKNSFKDILKTDTPPSGSGGPTDKPAGNSSLGVKAAKTPQELHEAVKVHIMEGMGITRTDPKFREEFDKIYNENYERVKNS